MQKWFKSRTNDLLYDIWADSDTVLEDQIKEMDEIISKIYENMIEAPSEPLNHDSVIEELRTLLGIKTPETGGQ